MFYVQRLFNRMAYDRIAVAKTASSAGIQIVQSGKEDP